MKQKCKFKKCSAQIQTQNLRKLNQASRDSVSEKEKKSETATTILQANKSAESFEGGLNKIDKEEGLEEHLGEEEEEQREQEHVLTPGPRSKVRAGDMRHSIDLEDGPEAIQARAANAVQNVLWSLTESDKTITNQLPASHMMGNTSLATPTQVQRLSSDSGLRSPLGMSPGSRAGRE